MISKACYKPNIIFFHFQLTVQDFLPIDTVKIIALKKIVPVRKKNYLCKLFICLVEIPF